jgi:hypothetical protein
MYGIIIGDYHGLWWLIRLHEVATLAILIHQPWFERSSSLFLILLGWGATQESTILGGDYPILSSWTLSNSPGLFCLFLPCLPNSSSFQIWWMIWSIFCAKKTTTWSISKVPFPWFPGVLCWAMAKLPCRPRAPEVCANLPHLLHPYLWAFELADPCQRLKAYAASKDIGRPKHE